MKKVRCQVKVVGILVTVVGSVLMIFYKGPFISFFRSQLTTASSPLTGDYLKATIFLLIASLSWAAFFILQVSSIDSILKNVVGVKVSWDLILDSKIV